MNKTRIILAESSDIMLNGLSSLIVDDPSIEIVGKASRYNILCKMITELHHDMVLVGPMINERYNHDLLPSLREKFPEIKIVEINIDDHNQGIREKIHGKLPGVYS
jgi:DNA-binding NarL/FixJ family response regulator